MAESLAALPHPPSLHTNHTGLLVLSINCDTFCADGTVILFQCAISLVQGICLTVVRLRAPVEMQFTSMSVRTHLI